MSRKLMRFFLTCVLLVAAAVWVNASQASLAHSSETSEVVVGDSGLSFRYVKTFGTSKEPYQRDTTYLNRPTGLYMDSDNDHIYVVEAFGYRVLGYELSGNTYLSFCNGGIAYAGDYVLCRPQDVVTDGSSNKWVADGNRIVQYDSGDNMVQQLPEEDPWKSGDEDDRFNQVMGIALYKNTHLLVSDSKNNRIQVYEFIGGSPVYSTTIGTGGADGYLNQPARIAIDISDNLYVADSGNDRVQKCSHSSGWTCSTFDSGLNNPQGITADGLNIYIADTENSKIRECREGESCSDFANTPDWVYDVAVDLPGNVYGSVASKAAVYKYDESGTSQGVFLGVEGKPYQTDESHYNQPRVTIDSSDNIIIIEENGQRLLKLDSQGNLLWPSPIGNPGVDAAHGGILNYPRGVATDASNNIYVADGDRVQVFNSSGDPQDPLEDNFSWVTGVAVDGAGNIFISDANKHIVKIYDENHGNIGQIGDTDVCGSTDTLLCRPMGLEVDSVGNIYVADSGNHQVQKFNSSLVKVMPLGTGVEGNEFDQFASPEDVAIDKDGRIYVADTSNHRVQVFDGSGAYLTTIGGAWGSEPARFRNVSGVTVDSAGNVYVSDFDNARIQMYAPDVPGWEQVNINGFGEKLNTAIFALEEFDGKLYAGTWYGAWSGEKGGRIWRSGDGRNWEPVSEVGLGTGSDYNKAIMDMVEFNGDLYASSYRGWEAQIWRCKVCDGSDWVNVEPGGFGDQNSYAFDALTVFNGNMYVGAGNTGDSGDGVEIWRSSTGDPGSWEEMLSTNNGNDNPNNKNILSFAEFNGDLYAGVMNETDGTEIWKTSNGDTWTPIEESEGGFEDINNVRIESLAVYNNYLYAGTHNGVTGAQIWRSIDGENWDPALQEDGFGDNGSGDDGAINFSVSSLNVIGGELYATTSNDATGIEVWRSSDGVAWEEQVNPDGFGDSNNEKAWTMAGSAIYQNALYIATWNEGNGGEIWKMLPGDTVTMDPGSDSSLTYEDPSGTETTIDIQAGSVTTETELQFTVVPEVTESPGFAFAGTAFTLDAYVDDLIQTEFTFNLPITITFKYTDQQIFGLDEDTLTLQYWDGITWQDAACGLYDRHPDENWLSVPICHLSEFGWFGEVKALLYLPLMDK